MRWEKLSERPGATLCNQIPPVQQLQLPQHLKAMQLLEMISPSAHPHRTSISVPPNFSLQFYSAPLGSAGVDMERQQTSIRRPCSPALCVCRGCSAPQGLQGRTVLGMVPGLSRWYLPQGRRTGTDLARTSTCGPHALSSPGHLQDQGRSPCQPQHWPLPATSQTP